MDGNLYEVLLGAAPTDPQKQAAVANQLRRRRSFGELGALTGDRVLQSFGEDATKSADNYAKLIQDTRQKDIDNAQTKAYQEGQLGHMRATEDLTRRGQNLDHVYQMLMAQAANERAEKTGTPKTARLTYADRNKLEQTAGIINNADELLSSFKKEYTQKFGPGPQSKLPNAMSAVGLSNRGMDEAANWWAGWNLIYSLPQRNATFGATLTPTEKRSWSESDINPAMDENTIRARAQTVVNILKQKGYLMNKTYQTQFDPEVIAEYGLPGAQTPQESPAPKAGALTPEEQAELMELRRKHRGGS